jgi:hypothetical protein
MSATAGLIYTSQYMPANFRLLVKLIENDLQVLHAKSHIHFPTKMTSVRELDERQRISSILHASQLELMMFFDDCAPFQQLESNDPSRRNCTESHLEIEMA